MCSHVVLKFGGWCVNHCYADFSTSSAVQKHIYYFVLGQEPFKHSLVSVQDFYLQKILV
jgi:hypothetical protein